MHQLFLPLVGREMVSCSWLPTDQLLSSSVMGSSAESSRPCVRKSKLPGMREIPNDTFVTGKREKDQGKCRWRTCTAVDTPCKLPYTTDGVDHTPLGRFFELDCSTTQRMPIPNHTSSERFRRDASKADVFWHRHYPYCGDIDRGKSAQRYVTYTNHRIR